MSQVVEKPLAERETEKVPPLRHLFFQPDPPQEGDVALCGARCLGSPTWTQWPRATRNHCVVCVEMARARSIPI